MQQIVCSGFVSAKAEIMARFVELLCGLRSAPSHEVRTMVAMVSWDLRTVTGKNIRTVECKSGCDTWTDSTGRVREAVMERELVAVPEEDAWRLPYLAKLLERRQRQYYLGLGTEDVQELIDSLCM